MYYYFYYSVCMLQPFGKPFCCRVGVPLVVLESSIRVAAKHQMYLYFYKVPFNDWYFSKPAMLNAVIIHTNSKR